MIYFLGNGFKNRSDNIPLIYEMEYEWRHRVMGASIQECNEMKFEKKFGFISSKRYLNECFKENI